MANTFKVVTNDAMPASAGTPLALYTAPGSTTTVVLGLMLCNINTTAVTASVKLTSSTSGGNPNANSDIFVVKNVNIPAGSSLEVLSGSKLILQTTDDILIDCSVTAKIDAALSIMEIT
jgi:hypothetical protein|tara:strand:+ start:63 stop:419 length:357 start_codon:yes stop_codon:yes gene_type:complete